MEVHLVHFNTKYNNLGTAADKSDGLAVLGIFFDITQGDELRWQALTSELAKVKNPNEKVESFKLSNMSLNSFLPKSTNEFYRYNGSLTTPPCYESVTWTVFGEPLPISEGQMSFFRSLQDGHGPMVNNFRPVQQLNER